MTSVFRLVFGVVVGVALLATTGIPSIVVATTHADCCEEGCDDSQCPEGSGCPPLCTACVCGAYFAPLLLVPHGVPHVLAVAVRTSPPSTRIPDHPPARGVFHPPRLSA